MRDRVLGCNNRGPEKKVHEMTEGGKDNTVRESDGRRDKDRE